MKKYIRSDLFEETFFADFGNSHTLTRLPEVENEVFSLYRYRMEKSKKTEESAYPKGSYSTFFSSDIITLSNKESDILTVHTPLNDGTRGAISRERLEMMKKDAVLVNVARGAVLDEGAVADAVLKGALGGFGCDVYTEEPFSENHPYRAILNHPAVVLTPHMAWGSHEARSLCLAEICMNIRSFLNGDVRNRVDLQ